MHLKLFYDISVQFDNEWDVVCTLLCSPLHNDVIDYFLYTRSFQEGIDFFNYCETVMQNTDSKDPVKESFVHDTIHIVRLVLYDKLNMWECYINAYDAFVPMQASTIKDKAKYDLVHKKLERLHKGKTTEHLKCRQRYELTDSELNARYEYLKRRIQKHIGGL